MWISKLPQDIQQVVQTAVAEYPATENAFKQVVEFYSERNGTKRQKVAKDAKPAAKASPAPQFALPYEGPTQVETISAQKLHIKSPISTSEIILELANLSFASPVRKKLNFVFHLLMDSDGKTPKPVFSAVSPTTKVPEITSITDLSSAFEFCVIIPILGNSTVSTKKDTVMMCIWLKDEVGVTEKNDPIIITLNLDLIKKQLVQEGKVPPNADDQVAHMTSTLDGIKPINEFIIVFLQRQFMMCGANLINYLPSANPIRNSVNMNEDTSVCISQNADSHNDLVMVEAYKGSKEGSLCFISVPPADENSPSGAYLIFGFKKPTLIFDFKSIKSVVYRDITRFTFSVVITTKEDAGETEIEFSMIDQKSFTFIEEFVKKMNIEDNSFDEKNREKPSQKETEKAENGGETQESSANAAPASDDEEEDGTYAGGVEEESDSEVDEEYNSDVNSDSQADSDAGSGGDSDDGSDSGGEGEGEEKEEAEKE